VIAVGPRHVSESGMSPRGMPLNVLRKGLHGNFTPFKRVPERPHDLNVVLRHRLTVGLDQALDIKIVFLPPARGSS
jgi:hypothetical protein